MKAWEKSVERAICKILGAVRLVCNGKRQLDGEHDWLAVEIKGRSEVPKWFVKGMCQAEAGRPKLPIMVIHEKGANYFDSFVVMRLRDFDEWFNPRGGRDKPRLPLSIKRATAVVEHTGKTDG